MTLFHSGYHEPLKLGVHGVFLGVGVLCLGYNAIAFSLRREPHLLLNVVVYSAVVWFEGRAVAHHRPC